LIQVCACQARLCRVTEESVLNATEYLLSNTAQENDAAILTPDCEYRYCELRRAVNSVA
jgi:hypothetical protein